ncbi:hypothetical protein PSHT_13918 [Puccinia striiformis]|uniref:Transmembrane protein n=1 Tax=Puccinia striiformis TaxID=27350 RepID=A0A2S4UN87_9BASI|nr:hypothetical protein PSHT_13918 [Puccinia striiformis]
MAGDYAAAIDKLIIQSDLPTKPRSTRTSSLSIPCVNLRNRSLTIKPPKTTHNKHQSIASAPAHRQKHATSHFTRSIISSSTKPLTRASKFSLATVNTNGLILVPSTGQPVTVKPITNVSTMPLYLLQPFLSPISTRSIPNTPIHNIPSISSFHHSRKRLGQLKSKLMSQLRPPPTTRHEEPKLLTQAEKTLMFKDHYCCFAIPLYNTGIYSILAQFTIFGFVFGILSFSAPSILAIVLDYSVTAFFGSLCLGLASIQAIGFYGVYKENSTIFKRYMYINLLFQTVTFGYSLILLIISATKHQISIDQCLLQFLSNEELQSDNGPSQSSRNLCNLWTWVQLGVCFLVWILLFLSELYFTYLVRVWGKDQQLDHIRYQSIISAVRQSTIASQHTEYTRAGEEWETGSMDLRPGAIGPNGQRSTVVAGGGSRLKNEIEWKEIEDDHRPIGDHIDHPLGEDQRHALGELSIDALPHPHPGNPSSNPHSHSHDPHLIDHEFYKTSIYV